MTRHGWWTCRWLALALILWAPAAGTAGAFQMFPEAEIKEAHALRQRILAEVPQLDLEQRREHTRLSPEAVGPVQQRLAALQAREAENPFFHWAQGELLRQTQGPAAAAAAFERARRTAGRRAVIHWLLWRDFLARDMRSEAEGEERALQGIQLTWGLTRFPLLADEEMRLAAEAAEGGDPARALALYDAALANTPESAAALMQRAGLIWQVDKTRLLEAIRNLASGLSQALRGRETGFQLGSNLMLSLLVAWLTLLCLVAILLSIKIQPLFGHELSERLLKGLPPSSQVSLGLLLFVLPLMLGLGLLWAAVAALLVCAPYVGRRERAAVSLLLAMLVTLPFGYEWVAARHILASSHRFSLVRAVEQGGRGETLVRELRQWIGEAPNAGLPRYYLGLVLKRRGELAQAEAEMAHAAQLLPRAGFVQVGLGNLDYLLGRLPEAEKDYQRAAGILPASAAVQLNLSKLYTQRLQLDQSDEALTRSLKLDPHTARTVSFFHGQGLTEFVVDEPVPWSALAAGLTPPIRDVRAVAEGFWGRPLSGVPLALLPYAAVLLLILFWAHVMLRGRTPPVRRCHQCGTPFCVRCQTTPKEKEYCSPCAAVFRQREGVAAFVRGLRIREGEIWVRREHARVGILGSVVPGGGDLYEGRIALGLLLCLPAVWLLAEGFVLEHLTPSLRFASPLPGPIRYPVAMLLLLALYLYSAYRSWRRPVGGAG
jgi:tetratricopeptide (TPR) repeat protein